MFNSEVYKSRRSRLAASMKEAGQSGIILFVGNAEAPAQYRDNCYKWRQDSTWLYYFGIDDPMFAAVIDLDEGTQTVFADDFTIDDIIWMGPQPSVSERAAKVGISLAAPYEALDAVVKNAVATGRKVHFLPPSRYYNSIKIADLTGRSIGEVRQKPGTSEGGPSLALAKAVIAMRIVKEECEIEQIDHACLLGYEMHSVARDSIRPGVLEQSIVGKMEAVSLAKGWGVSFPTILTQHGETLHNHSHDAVIEPGRLMVIDAGVENNMHYASDFTRTYPTAGVFTQKQKDVYQIVYECNELAFSLTRPGITYREVHIASARHMLERLGDLGLVHGDVDEMQASGVAGLFMPHGLGHNMGLDVHDMEDFDEKLVGYDPNQERSSQPGLGSLRMARKLLEGNVITDEPGIYFIPALIEKWKKEGKGAGFVDFAALERYYDFGGIRLEDDVLVTADGARRLGPKRLPIAPEDVEAAMAAARG